jgi:hypothetical protein
MVQLKDETKNNLIIFLLILTFFSLLGINLLRSAGDGFQSLVGGIIPYIRKLLGIVAYATGGVINTTTDIASDGARAGIDVVEGSVQSIGNLLQNASKGSINIDLDKGKSMVNNNLLKNNNTQNVTNQNTQNVTNQNTSKVTTAKKDESTNTIQNPIVNKKASSKWCLVGEYAGKRGCIAVDDTDVCMSQKIYNSLNECQKSK